MDLLKRFWPAPFKIEEKNVASFVIRLVIFAVVCTVVGWLIGLLAKIYIIGVIFSLIGSLMEIYCLVGVALCILKFIGVIK